MFYYEILSCTEMDPEFQIGFFDLYFLKIVKILKLHIKNNEMKFNRIFYSTLAQHAFFLSLPYNKASHIPISCNSEIYIKSHVAEPNRSSKKGMSLMTSPWVHSGQEGSRGTPNGGDHD